jgi:hypothetical protein
MVTLTNIAYPHTAVISRKVVSATPPFTSSSTEIWSGEVDCQVSVGGGTGLRQTVFVSDYTIFSACISPELVEVVDEEEVITPTELQTGDIITVTMGEGKTPFDCTIEQHTTENVWEEDGVAYGTTIWANRVKG